MFLCTNDQIYSNKNKIVIGLGWSSKMETTWLIGIGGRGVWGHVITECVELHGHSDEV